MIPRIVERFPRYRSRVLDALPRDHLLAELCEDYDMVVAALELEEGSPQKPEAPRKKSYGELIRLKRELEYELLERLAMEDET